MSVLRCLFAVTQLLEDRIDHIEVDVVMKDEGPVVSHYAYGMARTSAEILNLTFLAA